MIDLHSHSTASDGMLSPTELIRGAQKSRLKALALTDHDTTDGLDEAQAAAAEAGIDFVPGIEIEIEFYSGEFHLLGLGLQSWGPAFQEKLSVLKQKRHERNLIIFQKMLDYGIEGQFSEVEEISGGGMVGRPHFAQYLVKKGKVKNTLSAFKKFLGKGLPFYEKKAGMDLQMALDMIHDAGGLAIVAHPMSLYTTLTRLEPLLLQWKTLGLDGIEAYHPGTPMRTAVRLEALARSLDLKVSAGSDYHGDKRPDRRLGRTSGDMEIEDTWFFPLFGREISSKISDNQIILN